MRKRRKIRKQSRSSIAPQLCLLPKQIQLLESRARVVGFIAGYGAGKSFGGSVKALSLAAENCRPGANEGMIIAPTHKMLVRVTLASFMRLCNERGLIADHHKQEARIDLINGARVWYGSADTPGSLEGSNLSWFWLDEARLVSGEAYRILLGRLRVREAARLQGVITTTPKAGGWLQTEFDGGPDNRESIHSSSKENIFLAPDYIETLLDSYSEAQAKAYIDGQWVSLEGSVYPEFDRETHIIDYKPDPSLPVIGGVDFGFRWPAACFGQVIPDARNIGGKIVPPGSLILFDEDTTDNLSTEALGRRIAAKFRESPLTLDWLACDPAGASFSSSASEHGGIEDVKALKLGLREGGVNPRVRYVFGRGTAALRSINTGIERVRAMLKSARGETKLYFARDLEANKSQRGLLRAIPGLIYKEGTSSVVRGRDAAQQDHMCDSVRYAVRHLHLRGVSFEQYA